MGMFGRVLSWACAAIAVLVGGMAFLAGEMGLAIGVLVGMVVIGLVLRWIYR